MAKKPSMGRQKIKIEKIEIKNHLQVTFSKRRSGLYKKAHELGTLCGVELAIIVFSPAGKVFSFGNPNVDCIIDKFTSRNKNHPPPQPRSSCCLSPADHAHRNPNSTMLRELNSQLTQIVNELEVEKKRGDAFDVVRKGRQNQYWWESPIDELGLNQVEQLRDAMEALKKNITDQAGKVMAAAATNSSSLFILDTNNCGDSGDPAVFEQYESKPSKIISQHSVTPNIYNCGIHEHGLF